MRLTSVVPPARRRRRGNRASATIVTRSPAHNPAIPILEVPIVVLDAIRPLKSPVVIAHVVPDADALGSMLGLARAWRQRDVNAKVAIPDRSTSQRLAFLVDWSRVPTATDADFASADGFVVLDTAKQSRCNVGPELKDTEWAAGRPVINIDHHATNTRFATVNWVDASLGSAAELVYRVLYAEGWMIDSVTASLLYAGIQTDTLGFSLPTTAASSLQSGAHLVALGANVGELGERLYRSQRRSEFDLLRVIYANTSVVAGGQIAYSSASYEEIHDAGCTAADIDDQINVPRSLDGVRLAMLFTEGRRGKTRINFRASGNVTTIGLAAEFGGGGHTQSSGAILDCGLKKAIAKVIARAEEHLKRFDDQ